ncbi:MAG: T9SS type A sorting domain-containing protein [Aureispira sp.]|nr:T9SS type A sorting domain-containing protein [Aureispira sp.]
MNTINRFILVLLLSSFGLSSTTAQLSWNTTSTGNIQLNVCHEEDTIHVSFSNVSGGTMVSDSLIVELPAGVFYIPGSIVESTSFFVTEIDITNLRRPIFTLKNLPAIGSTVDFYFRVRANCEAIDHYEGGGGFQNIYTYYHDGLNEPPHTTPDFNINYPALSLSNVTNANVNVTLGSTYLQELTITNGGNGPIDAFFVALNPPAGMQFSGATAGILNVTNDTIFFDSSHLGPDGLFTSGENIIVEYQIEILSCIDLATDLYLSWGCDGVLCKTDVYPISATVPPVAPILSTTRTYSGVVCFDEPDPQEVMIINTGTGLATNVEFEIFSGNAYGNPASAPNRGYPIDTSSITIQSGIVAAAMPISPISTQNGTNVYFSHCDPTNRIGRARISLANIDVGDTIIIKWTQMACCPKTCNQSYAFNSWEYKVDYENDCETEVYTSNYIRGSRRGYDNISKYSAIPSNPTDINDGDTSNFVLEYTASVGLSNPSPDGWLEVNVILPVGVTFSGDFEYYNRFFTCSRVPDSLVQVADTVKAFFDFSTLVGCIGGNGGANKAEMHIGLVADCSQPGAVSGPLSIPINTYLVLYPSCSDVCKIPMFCKIWDTELHCPEPCPDGGLQFTSFSAQRQNLGAVDNDNNGQVDATGTLDMNIIRSKTVIAGDTLALHYEGTVSTSATNPQFEFIYLDTRMLNMAANARTLNAIEANIQVFDASTGTTHTCNNSTITTNSTNNFSIDINGCVPAGFVFEDGDSIAVDAFYRFVTKFNGQILVHEIQNDFYVSRIANPTDTADQYACNTLGDYFKTIGYYHTTCCGGSRNISSCNSTQVSKNYYLSIGPCCNNYANGNYFRNEIRQFSFIDTFEFLMPSGFVLDNTMSADFRYVYTGGSVGYANITPIDPTANPVRFVLGDFFEPRGGTYPISDEGYYGTVRMYIKPTCDAPESDRIYYYGHYQGVDTTETFYDDFRGTNELINYTGPDLEVASITPIVVSTTDTVVWQFRIDNNSNAADSWNTFFRLASAAGGIVIEEVRDIGTSSVLTTNANGFYELGNISPSTSNIFEIVATQNSCIQDSLMVLVGWDCTDYPTDLATYSCTLDTAFLKVINPESALQVAVLRDTTSTTVDSIEMCTPITYEMEFTSSQSSVVMDVLATIPSLPSGLTFELGSVEYEYPAGSGFQLGVDPTAIGPALQFDISNYTPSLNTEGLLGTVDADSVGDRKIKVRFRVETDCDFISGDAFNVQISAERPCGDPLPNINYTVAPILVKGTGVTPYITQMTLNSDVITACGDKNPYFYNVQIVNFGPGVTSANDSILIRLPAGIVMHSYDPTNPSFNNAPTGQPTVTTSASGTELSWPMVAGVAAAGNITFSIRIDAEDVDNICGAHDPEVLSLISSSVFCVASATTCNTSTPSGRGTSTVIVDRPRLFVGIDTMSSSNNQYDASNNAIILAGHINNTGIAVPAGDTLTVEFFCDNDASGGYTPGDTYIGSYSNDGGLPMGDTIRFAWIDTFNVGLCHLLGGEMVVATLRPLPNVAPRQCACEYGQRLVQDILLPVDLVTFVGEEQATNCQVKLMWETAAEENLNYFEIQRSIDGLNFETLGQVQAVGSSRTQQIYDWLDTEIGQAAYYYRLKIVEFGGGTRYSELMHIQTPCGAYQGQSGIVELYPNPTKGNLNIKFHNSQKTELPAAVHVLDVLGKVVLQSNQKIATGTQLIQLDLKSIPAGTYTIEFRNEHWSTVKKFVKLR